VIAAGVLLLALGADPARITKDFTEANELALKGEAKSAIALYESILAEGVEHQDLYLNLGNAYAESGRQIDAIIAYERGLRIAPGDDDLRANLEFLRARLEKKSEVEGGGAVVLADAIEPFIADLPLDVFAYLAIVFSSVLFAAMLFRKRWLAIAGGIALAIALVGVGGHYVLARDPRAVVLETAEVKEGPHERFKASGTVPAGARVRVIEEEPSFVKILRRDGTSGWVSAKKITRV
jgi:tetratricopeptide (TPR) repeat protein